MSSWINIGVGETDNMDEILEIMRDEDKIRVVSERENAISATTSGAEERGGTTDDIKRMIRRNREFNGSKVCIMRGDDTGPGNGQGTVYEVESGELNRKRNVSGICKVGDLRITGDALA